MNASQWLPQSRSRRTGLTLIEMIISVSLLTIIMGGSAALVMVAAKGMANDVSNVGTAAVTARSVTDQITDDLKLATTITEQTAKAITMTVPDRDGDGVAETIRYAWSGVAGDPLTRKYNSRAVATLAKDVRALNFTYLAKTAGKPPPVEGDEEVLFLHQGAGATVVQSNLTSTAAVAAYFKPTLPEKAVLWKVTKFQCLLENTLLETGTVTAQLKYVDTSLKPMGAALQTTNVSAVSLGGNAVWTTLSFSSPAELDPSKGVCLVLTYTPILGNGPKVSFHNANTDPKTAWATSSDGGATWGTPSTASAIQGRAYGKVTTQEAETLDFQALPAAP